jgi:hypothetical protein
MFVAKVLAIKPQRFERNLGPAFDPAQSPLLRDRDYVSPHNVIFLWIILSGLSHGSHHCDVAYA